VLIRQGEFANYVFLIAKGEVEVIIFKIFFFNIIKILFKLYLNYKDKEKTTEK